MSKAQHEIDADIVEAMVAEAKQTLEDGRILKPGDVVNTAGNTDAPYPMVVGSVERPGLVPMWDTITRELSWSDTNNLATNLGKTRDDGSPVFTRTAPAIPAKRGSVKCRLHLDDDERERWNELGFPICKKATLVNEYQRDRHMQRKHKSEYAAIESADLKKRDEEWKNEQRLMFESQRALIDLVKERAEVKTDG